MIILHPSIEMAVADLAVWLMASGDDYEQAWLVVQNVDIARWAVALLNEGVGPLSRRRQQFAMSHGPRSIRILPVTNKDGFIAGRIQRLDWVGPRIEPAWMLSLHALGRGQRP